LIVKYIDSFQFYDGPVNESEKAFGGAKSDRVSTRFSNTEQTVSKTYSSLLEGSEPDFLEGSWIC